MDIWECSRKIIQQQHAEVTAQCFQIFLKILDLGFFPVFFGTEPPTVVEFPRLGSREQLE